MWIKEMLTKNFFLDILSRVTYPMFKVSKHAKNSLRIVDLDLFFHPYSKYFGMIEH